MKKLSEYGFKAVNLYFSAVCNLECTYCFQPKISGHMTDVNKEIIEWISSGRMEEDVEDKIGKDIEVMTFWGGEPSMNIPYIIERLPHILERFPKLNSFMYSTNMSTKKLAENSFNFIKALSNSCKDTGRKLHLNLQVSIDGVPAVNDSNRINSSGDKIASHLTWLLEQCRIENIPERVFQVSIKGTHGSDSLKFLNTDNNLFNHYKYFDDLCAEWSSIHPSAPRGSSASFLTFAYPGNYTKEDGKILSEITEKLFKMKEEYQWKSNPSFNHQISERVRLSLDYIRQGSRKPTKGELLSHTGCSAGRSCAGITHTGEYHWCQATYFFDKRARDYIEEKSLVTDFEINSGFSFRNFEAFVDKHERAPFDNDIKLSHSLLIPFTTRSQLPLRISYIDMLIQELVAADLISDIYSNKYYRDLAIIWYLFGGNNCISDDTWEFGSSWTVSESLFKLALNGTFEKVINNLQNTYRRKDL